MEDGHLLKEQNIKKMWVVCIFVVPIQDSQLNCFTSAWESAAMS
jgi:hypothetical protein